MEKIRILDCTLRDGGFVNDWNFGIGSIKSVASRLAKSGVEIIEVGFIDERRSYDADRSIFPDTASIKPALRNIDRRGALFVGMIDFGTCALERIESAADSCLDGIRVIFKKKDQDAALSYLAEIKAKGYKVFVNPVSVTGYSIEEAKALAEKINLLGPYAVSIVDTYGLMHEKELEAYYRAFDSTLDPRIEIGYHSHNNFQLAYSNSIFLSKMDSARPLVIDSSLYGMGKGAGNANTELVAMYLNENRGKAYGIDQLLEAIDVDILKEFDKQRWGYSLPYYLAALNDCHPDYVKNLLGKKTLAVKNVNELLGRIHPGKKLTFDKEAIEAIYLEAQQQQFDDSENYKKLSSELGGRPVLLIGPGASIEREAPAVAKFIGKTNPLVFSINFVSEAFPIDFVFMGNAKRFSQFFHKIYGEIRACKVVCTSNVVDIGRDIDYTFNFAELCIQEESVRDNPLLLLIQILIKAGVAEVYLAGFDGYAEKNEANYFKDYIPYLYCADDVMKRNNLISSYLDKFGESIRIRSLTPSIYRVVRYEA